MIQTLLPKNINTCFEISYATRVLFDELPRKHFSPNPSITPPLKQTIMSTPPKQSSSPTILTKPMNPFMETTANLFFPLNLLQKNDLNLVMEEIEAVTDEVRAIAQAPIDTKTSWSNQETETKGVAMKYQIQVKETTNFGDEKLQTKVGGDHSGQVDQQAVANQNHRYEVISKTIYVLKTCEKFERTCSIVFVDVDKVFLSMIPTCLGFW